MTVKRIFGSGPNQIARNKDLGSLAWQNKTGLNLQNTGATYIVGGSPALPNAAQIGFYDDGSSNGHLEFYTTASGTVTERLRLDSAGNLGLGVTPSAWPANWLGTKTQSIEIGGAGTAISGGPASLILSTNAYNNGANWIYATSNYAVHYQQLRSSGSHIWFNAPAGTAGNAITFTQAMTLDASGNLGIGTSSPGAKLDVIQSSVGSSGASASGGIRVITTGTATGFSVGQSNVARNISINSYSVTSSGTEFILGATGAYWLQFETNGSERMRIDSSGNLLVAKTTAGQVLTKGAELSSNGGISATTDVANNSSYFVNIASSGTRYLQRFYAGSTLVGSITSDGTNTTYGTSSDYRLKENIQPMQGALAVVQQLNPVTYTWKADGSDGQGFIAHELQAVVPDCVTGEKDAVDEEGKPVYQGIDTSFLVATLTKAIQELKAELDELKAKVN